jgi:hypothetical protein
MNRSDRQKQESASQQIYSRDDPPINNVKLKLTSQTKGKDWAQFNGYLRERSKQSNPRTRQTRFSTFYNVCKIKRACTYERRGCTQFVIVKRRALKDRTQLECTQSVGDRKKTRIPDLCISGRYPQFSDPGSKRISVVDNGCSVARWHIFKPKIPIWVNFGRSCN